MMSILLNFVHQVSDRNRERKFDLFCNLFKLNSSHSILDIGASELEYRETGNIIEKRYPYPERITMLGIADFVQFRQRYPKVRIVKYGGGTFPFKDNSFDACWCNAVLEHVGGTEKQETFLKEIARVARKRFVTTPNKYFIYEPHTRVLFLHYLPRKIFDRILLSMGKPWAVGDYMNLLGKNDIIKLLEKCNITEYQIIENRLFGFVIDFVIIF